MKKLLIALCFVLTLTGVCAAQDAYVEEVLTIDGADYQIPATLCRPAEDGVYPAVVMLHGTGSNRDEAGGGYAFAAPILAEKYGLVTLRIDFPGNGDSEADYTLYTFDSAVADAVTAAEYLRSLDFVDGAKIGVMGWSQGGTDALLAAGEHPEIFTSVVTWAGAPDLNDMLSDEAYAEAEANGYFVMEFDWRDELHVSKQWCDDVRNVDVLAVFESYEGPVLAVHGEADDTVDPEWSNMIVSVSVNEASATHFIPEMDHTFNVFTGDMTAITDAVDATGAFFAETL